MGGDYKKFPAVWPVAPERSWPGARLPVCRGGAGRGRGGLLEGLGDAERGPAMPALGQLAADVVRDRDELAAAQVGADELDGHWGVRLLFVFIGRPDAGLESAGVRRSTVSTVRR